MQALTASPCKEQTPLKTFAVEITKLPNTMTTTDVTILTNGYNRQRVVDSSYFHGELERGEHDSYPVENGLEMETPLKKKQGRQKKTVPKPQDNMEECCNGMDVNMEAVAACTLESRRECETPNSFLDSVCEDEEEEDDEERDVQDFRRFSSRMRKHTSFFGVMDKNHRNSGSSRRGERRIGRDGKKRRGNGVKRMLQFDHDPANILFIKPNPVQKEKIPTIEETKDLPQTMEGVDQLEDKKPDGYQEVAQQLPREKSELELQFPIGTMTWGKLLGYDWWPGCVISHDEGGKGKRDKEIEDNSLTEEERSAGPQFWIKWFGDNQLSQIPIDHLARFEEFKDYFKPVHMKGIYRRAIIAALKEAAKRCKVEFVSHPDDKKLRWIVTEGCPIPKLIDDKKVNSSEQENEPVKISLEESEPNKKEGQESKPVEPADAVPTESRGGQKSRGRKEKGSILLTSLEQEMIDWAMNGFLPSGPTGLLPTEEQQIPVQVVPMDGDLSVVGRARLGGGMANEGGEEPPRKRPKMMLLQVKRKARFESVKEGNMSISELCIGCGDMSVLADHPLFEGGFCIECKERFMECAYLFDEDGTQMYCTICSGGDEVFMCDAENCAKVYCGPCIEKLCGADELEKVKAADQWLCFMCAPDCNKVGLLARREDWVHKLRELFLNDNEMEYDPLPFYPPLPPEERRPIRVLGLFDGIATGLLVLKELGIEVAKYVSSEIDMDAMYVSRVEHKEIVHVGDIERITEKEVKAWGPFDLVIGGSPCNDLSIVNPARKGIYEGTGRLFFEFFRVLSYTRPSPNEDRPFFWLFENVVSMRAVDKRTISRFFQCNPVVIDAKEISAAHRARYFWGNLPGMNRPTIPRPGDRLTLQECLEPNCFRHAQFTKLRTITTKMNSIKQTKKAIYPVKVEGQAEDEGDVLWCTEMERLFGFPEHYTDVANLGRCGRQRLLGKAWSVPVIRHLLSPLKDYFKSNTTKETISNSCNTGT